MTSADKELVDGMHFTIGEMYKELREIDDDADPHLLPQHDFGSMLGIFESVVG